MLTLWAHPQGSCCSPKPPRAENPLRTPTLRHPEHHRCIAQCWRSGSLAPALLLLPWDPALLSLPRNCPENSLFPPRTPALPTPALENAVGLRTPRGWGSHAEPTGSMESGWVPPGWGHFGAGALPPPSAKHQTELSHHSPRSSTHTGSKLQAGMPKSNPRTGRAAHSSQVFLEQMVRSRVPPPQHRCPSLGSASPPSNWAEPEQGLLHTPGFLHERVSLKRPMFIACHKASAPNPICKHKRCCWQGLAVHPAGRSVCSEEGSSSCQHHRLMSYTSTGPSFAPWGHGAGAGQGVIDPTAVHGG